MPNYWCKCNDCNQTFLVTSGSAIRCPVCQSSNVSILSTIEDQTDMDDEEEDLYRYY